MPRPHRFAALLATVAAGALTLAACGSSAPSSAAAPAGTQACTAPAGNLHVQQLGTAAAPPPAWAEVRAARLDVSSSSISLAVQGNSPVTAKDLAAFTGPDIAVWTLGIASPAGTRVYLLQAHTSPVAPGLAFSGYRVAAHGHPYRLVQGSASAGARGVVIEVSRSQLPDLPSSFRWSVTVTANLASLATVALGARTTLYASGCPAPSGSLLYPPGAAPAAPAASAAPTAPTAPTAQPATTAGGSAPATASGGANGIQLPSLTSDIKAKLGGGTHGTIAAVDCTTPNAVAPTSVAVGHQFLCKVTDAYGATGLVSVTVIPSPPHWRWALEGW